MVVNVGGASTVYLLSPPATCEPTTRLKERVVTVVDERRYLLFTFKHGGVP